MTTVEILEAAREKIAQGWTQLAAARDVLDHVVDTDSITAVKYSALGALTLVARSLRLNEGEMLAESAAYKSMMILSKATGREPEPFEGHTTLIIRHNTTINSQADALAWFDRAIQLAKERETP
jgi:hypothetical protein